MKRKFGCAKIPGYLQSSPKGLQSHPNVIPHELRSMEVTPVAGTQIPGFREVPGAAVMATRPTSRETPLEQPSPTPALSGKAGGSSPVPGKVWKQGQELSGFMAVWESSRSLAWQRAVGRAGRSTPKVASPSLLPLPSVTDYLRVEGPQTGTPFNFCLDLGSAFQQLPHCLWKQSGSR